LREKPEAAGRAAPEKKYAPYEPEATRLVLAIQAEADAGRTKAMTNALVELLYPFLLKTARYALPGDGSRAEDVLHTQILRHLLCGRRGLPNKKNGVYLQYIYAYQPDYASDTVSDSENCFCGYLASVLKLQFLQAYREDEDVVPETRLVFDPETQREKAVRGYARNTVSLDQASQDAEGGAYEAGAVSLKAAMQAQELLRQAEADELRQQADAALVRELADLYRRFFDQVNALDETVSGSRAVQERGILAYHMAFPCRHLRGPAGGKDRPQDLPAACALPFRALAQQRWQEPLRRAVNEQNAAYQEIFLSDLDFLPRLRQRVARKNIGAEPFLDSPADIANRAYGWIDTIERRVRPAFDALPAQAQKARRKIGNAIF
jgi:hypothetical protein